jgi:YVTN family beta-propeller protein
MINHKPITRIWAYFVAVTSESIQNCGLVWSLIILILFYHMKHLLSVTCLFSIILSCNAQQKEGPAIVKTFHISSAGGWDYIAVNRGKLYVSHGTQVNILDEITGDSLGYIPNTTGVHGIAFDNELNRGYTSNGRLNNVTVFNLATNDTIVHVATGENPDAILYEPFSKTIITCNGRSKDLTVIDPRQNKAIATIPVGGKPEAAVADGSGKLYVNIEDKNEIAVVDIKSWTVIAHWPLSPGESPTGLAIDVKTKRLFAGCEKLLIVIDAATGKVIDNLTIGNGCDGVVFDVGSQTIYTANGEGTITAIKEESADKYSTPGNYSTKRGARTLTIDPDHHILFLPTAEFEAATTANGRPKMIPGTFQVLVVKY